jgi:hypothetical protein
MVRANEHGQWVLREEPHARFGVGQGHGPPDGKPAGVRSLAKRAGVAFGIEYLPLRTIHD